MSSWKSATALVVVALLNVSLEALAQDASSGRRVPEPRRVDPPVEAASVARIAEDDERQLEFHRGLDEIALASRREAEREAARRHAPFDLDWGLR